MCGQHELGPAWPHGTHACDDTAMCLAEPDWSTPWGAQRRVLKAKILVQTIREHSGETFHDAQDVET